MLIYVCAVQEVGGCICWCQGAATRGFFDRPAYASVALPLVPASGKPWPSVLDRALALTGPLLANNPQDFGRTNRYDSFSDVGEIRVYFASKILTPCRMH